MNNYESRTFNNVHELEVITLGLPKATLADISIDGKNSERFKAVVNDDTKEAETIVSNRYTLIQHSDIFFPVIEAMKNLGVGIKGKVIVDGGRVYADVFFNDERLAINVGADRKVNDIVNFGMRFFNSYDKSTSFGAEVVAMRLVCLNGMVAPIKLKSIHEVHTGDKKMVIKSITKLFETIVEVSPNFADIVSRSREDIITMKMLQELLQGWNMGEKHIKNILKMAKKVDELNGWTIFNVLTDYISHQLEVREATKERWHKQYANQILNVPIQALLARRKISGA